MTYGLIVKQGRETLANTGGMSKEQVVTFLQQTIYASNRAINAAFRNGNVTASGYRISVYKDRA